MLSKTLREHILDRWRVSTDCGGGASGSGEAHWVASQGEDTKPLHENSFAPPTQQSLPRPPHEELLYS